MIVDFRRSAARISSATGLNPLQFYRFLRGIPHYLSDRRKFRKLWDESSSKFEFEFRDGVSFSADRFESAGATRGHYFIQDLYVAQRIFQSNPARHVDVGSRIDGFVAHVAAFRSLDVLDVRPLQSPSENIHFHQVDLMDLDPNWISCTDSLSCLHALEHFGLGRYGDPLDPDGWQTGLLSLFNMLASGGTLYLSVPTGRTQRVEFNAQRVFSLEGLHDELIKYFRVQSLVVVSEAGILTKVNLANGYLDSSTVVGQYDCSIWELQKS